MSKTRILVAHHELRPSELEKIAAVSPDVEARGAMYVNDAMLSLVRANRRPEQANDPLPDGSRFAGEAASADVIFCLHLPPDICDMAPRLKWVQCIGAGTGQLQTAGLAEAGIRLTSGAGANAVAIAEFVVGRVLQEWKRFREIDAAAAQKRWTPLFGRQLAGASAGLIGLGAINGNVASRLKAFGVRVLATRKSAKRHPDVDEIYVPERLEHMLGQCDLVIAAAPSTPETAGLMNRQRFAAMRRGAFFCNVGRGNLVDEPALIEALQSGQLRAAALDVTNAEPMPADDPLWDAPSLYLSAHCAADPHALFVNLHRLFRDNIKRFLAGQPLINEVDLASGY